MRVAFVNLFVRGGIGHHSQALVRAVAERTPTAVVIADHGSAEGYAPAMVHRIAAPPDVVGTALRSLDLRQWVRISRALHDFAPDVVHVLDVHPWASLIARMVPAVPLAFSLHDPELHSGEDRGVRALMMRLTTNDMLTRASLVFVHADRWIKGVAARTNGAVRAMTLLPGPIADLVPEDFQRAANTVLFIGRIVGYKGLDVLLQAIPHIRASVPSARFAIVGEGSLAPYAGALRAHSDAIDIVNRYVADAEMAEWLARCAIVVLPYRDATQSGIVPLAFSASDAVVATDVGAFAEIVRSGENGLLIPPGDPGALTAAVVKLLRDDDFARALGDNGRRFYDAELRPEPVAEHYLTTVAQLLANRR